MHALKTTTQYGTSSVHMLPAWAKWISLNPPTNNGQHVSFYSFETWQFTAHVT